MLYKLTVILIGLPKEWLVKLKTKQIVDHVGPSVLLELCNPGLSKTVKQSIYLNNNLLTVVEAMETKDAMEDGQQRQWNTSKIMVLAHNLNIHTLLELEHVKNKVEVSKFLQSQLHQAAML